MFEKSRCKELENESGSKPDRFIGLNLPDNKLVDRRTAFPEKSSLVVPLFPCYNAA